MKRKPVTGLEGALARLSSARSADSVPQTGPDLGHDLILAGDVSTLYLEADQGDGFREPGFSEERRLEPQITIGLLTGQDGSPSWSPLLRGTEPRRRRPYSRSYSECRNRP